ncbi:hypothetical protein GGS23DRAFT_276114 [Durotheca rogersii]|uniref:uncharacterized protein n=1 Tax=Durotheca rogersii TaxID=419775 RepID=UPI00221F69B5|nr:uncharacterized protein GGS23DRAFT_276114 [Durotheca rogersii]KAI5866540.1 hypothetical protein GGS23DRAFT_276114 [Durotheca rogersii]
MSCFVTCTLGHEHWGRYGAAGLLIYRFGASGEVEMLLQLRAPWLHHGDTWGLPGGALESGETAEQAAFREAREELGVDAREYLEPGGAVVDDSHGSWHYTTILAALAKPLEISDMTPNDESVRLQWFTRRELRSIPLHPGLQDSIGTLIFRLPPDIEPCAAAAALPTRAEAS